MIKQMNPGSVIVVFPSIMAGALKPAGPTTLLDPTFIVHHVVHYCVPNMAASVPRDRNSRLVECPAAAAA